MRYIFRSVIIFTSYIIFIAILLKSISYYRIYNDTDSIIKDFNDVICDSKNTNINYGELMIYDHSCQFPIVETDNVNVDRIYVNHNFEKGYMYVHYSYEINPDDSENTDGASSEAIWHIQKRNGRWEVYAIDERMGSDMIRMGTINDD